MITRILPTHNAIGTLPAIGCKSYLHRVLYCAALAGTPCVLRGYTHSKDAVATCNAIRALGMESCIQEGDLALTPTAHCASAVDVLESGTTLRLLLPLLGAKGIGCTITMAQGLRLRPMDSIAELKQHGMHIEALPNGYAVCGQLTSGQYHVDTTVSSQYLSALLLALPLLTGDSTIVVEGKGVSQGYVSITLEVMATYGVRVQRTDYGYYVPGGQRYITPNPLWVQGDYSNAAFALGLGALYGRVIVEGLQPDSVQPDRAIVRYLQDMGADVSIQGTAVTVAKPQGNLLPLDADLSGCPDLAPILAVLCAHAQGTSTLRGLSALVYKESNRLRALYTNLSMVGVPCVMTQDTLTIQGGTAHITGGVWRGYNDHRMVMSGAVLLYNKGGHIDDSQAVAKSYPQFWTDYHTL